MPITTLDPVTALVVIDLQKGIVGDAEGPVADVVARARLLADTFEHAALPVAYVTVAGTPPGRVERSLVDDAGADFAELASGLAPGADAIRVSKQAWGAFATTDLDDQLRGAGVTQVVLAGVATSIGVESTARFAHEHGYNVAVVTDAVADLDPDAHRHSLTKIFPILGETGTTDEIVATLKERHR